MTDTIEPICDFCSSKQIVWSYPCGSFLFFTTFTPKKGIPFEFPWGSGGSWAACETCAELIESDEWDALATRSFHTSPALVSMQNLLQKDDVINAIRRLHVNFKNLRKGERVKIA